MSFIKSKNEDKYRGGQIEEKEDQPPPKPCISCGKITPHADLVIYGARCRYCYNTYLRQTPTYRAEPDKYPNDPRGWARRIIDKHNAGANINPTTLKMANDALKIKVKV